MIRQVISGGAWDSDDVMFARLDDGPPWWFASANPWWGIIILNYFPHPGLLPIPIPPPSPKTTPPAASIPFAAEVPRLEGHPGAAHLFAGMWKLIAVVHSCGIWPKFLSSQCPRRPALPSGKADATPLAPAPPGFPLSVVVWALKSWKQCAFSSRVCVALDRVFRLLLYIYFFLLLCSLYY